MANSECNWRAAYQSIASCLLGAIMGDIDNWTSAVRDHVSYFISWAILLVFDYCPLARVWQYVCNITEDSWLCLRHGTKARDLIMQFGALRKHIEYAFRLFLFLLQYAPQVSGRGIINAERWTLQFYAVMMIIWQKHCQSIKAYSCCVPAGVIYICLSPHLFFFFLEGGGLTGTRLWPSARYQEIYPALDGISDKSWYISFTFLKKRLDSTWDRYKRRFAQNPPPL